MRTTKLPCTFQAVPVGQVFLCNSTLWTKQSSRTAFRFGDSCSQWKYFRQCETCTNISPELSPELSLPDLLASLNLLASPALSFARLELVISGVSFQLCWLPRSHEFRLTFTSASRGATYYLDSPVATVEKMLEVLEVL